jgi:hypothetical protein
VVHIVLHSPPAPPPPPPQAQAPADRAVKVYPGTTVYPDRVAGAAAAPNLVAAASPGYGAAAPPPGWSAALPAHSTGAWHAAQNAVRNEVPSSTASCPAGVDEDEGYDGYEGGESEGARERRPSTAAGEALAAQRVAEVGVF